MTKIKIKVKEHRGIVSLMLFLFIALSIFSFKEVSKKFQLKFGTEEHRVFKSLLEWESKDLTGGGLLRMEIETKMKIELRRDMLPTKDGLTEVHFVHENIKAEMKVEQGLFEAHFDSWDDNYIPMSHVDSSLMQSCLPYLGQTNRYLVLPSNTVVNNVELPEHYLTDSRLGFQRYGNYFLPEFPEDGIRKGNKWTERLGPSDMFPNTKIEKLYRCTNQSPELLSIGMRGTMQPDAEEADGGFHGQMKGDMDFDKATGMMVEARLWLRLAVLDTSVSADSSISLVKLNLQPQ